MPLYIDKYIFIYILCVYITYIIYNICIYIIYNIYVYIYIYIIFVKNYILFKGSLK